MEFRKTDGEPIIELDDGFHLFLGQTLEAVKEGKKRYRLRTLAYAYRIAEGPRRTDPYIVRWEYVSPEHHKKQHNVPDAPLHPRHHCHLPINLTCFGTTNLSLDKMHIASGWVTMEEVLRFLFHELKVPSRSANWDQILRESEQTFKQRTARSI